MKRIMIVIVAGLAFGVTAAYAATGHSKSSPAQTPHTGSQQTFAVPPLASTGPTTESDDPVTEDQGDDQGEDTQPSTEPPSDESSQDDQGEDSQADDSQGEDSQGDDDSQSGQQDDSQSEDSGGDASGD